MSKKKKFLTKYAQHKMKFIDELKRCILIKISIVEIYYMSDESSLIVSFDQVGELLGTLIKTFKAAFLPFFDELSSYLMPMWVRITSCYLIQLSSFNFMLFAFH